MGICFAGLALQVDSIRSTVGDVIMHNRTAVSGVVESVSWRGVRLQNVSEQTASDQQRRALGKETIEVAPQNNLNARLVMFNTVYSQSRPQRRRRSSAMPIRQVR